MAKQPSDDSKDPPEMTSNAPVVIGVVASAGGLAALKSMCSELDQLVGASMIVTQHVSPTYHD